MDSNLRVTFIASFSALGALLFGLDIGYIAPILECQSFKRDVAHLEDWETGSIPPATAGFIVGSFSIGCVLSSLPVVSGNLMTAYGRRGSIIIGAFVFQVAVAIQMLATSVNAFVIGRFAAGCCIGLLSAVVVLYQSELAPTHLRGALSSLYQLMITLGILLASLADWMLVETDGGWRTAICLTGVPAIILLVGMHGLPESPQWLVQHGRETDAEKVLYWLRESQEEAAKELKLIKEEFHNSLAADTPRTRPSRVARLLTLGILMQLLQQFVGINALMYFGPRIFTMLGLPAFTMQCCMQATMFMATFVAVMFADSCGRRRLLIFGAGGMATACFGIGVFGRLLGQEQELGEHTQHTFAASGCLAMLCLFMVSFASSWGPIVWVYNAEIFPLKYRGYCVSMTTTANWVGNYMVAQFTPVLLDRYGFDTFLLFGIFCALALSLAFWIPETKGVPLERVGELFDDRFGDIGCGDDASVASHRYGAMG